MTRFRTRPDNYYYLSKELICRFPEHHWLWPRIRTLYPRWDISFYQERRRYYAGIPGRTEDVAYLDRIINEMSYMNHQREDQREMQLRELEMALRYKRAEKQAALEAYIRDNCISKDMLEQALSYFDDGED